MDSRLKILMVNWIWYRHAGEEWAYIDNLKKLYENHGHEVIPFSIKSAQNIETKGYENYFVEYINYKELNKKRISQTE